MGEREERLKSQALQNSPLTGIKASNLINSVAGEKKVEEAAASSWSFLCLKVEGEKRRVELLGLLAVTEKR